MPTLKNKSQSKAKLPAKNGRPTVFKPEYVGQAEAFCHLGATETDLANFFNVSTVTLWRWRSKYPDFSNALKVGKDAADQRVVSSLYHRANGYTYDAVKIFPPSGKRKTPLIVPYKEHVPPDTTAAIFWLKNRKRKEWSDHHDVRIINEYDKLSDDELAEELKRAAQLLESNMKVIEHEDE